MNRNIYRPFFEYLCINNLIENIYFKGCGLNIFLRLGMITHLNMLNHMPTPNSLRKILCVNKLLNSCIKNIVSQRPNNISLPILTVIGNHHLRLDVKGRKPRTTRKINASLFEKMPFELFYNSLECLVRVGHLNSRKYITIGL